MKPNLLLRKYKARSRKPQTHNDRVMIRVMLIRAATVSKTILISRAPHSLARHSASTSVPNQTYRLEFFLNAACDSSGYGEGEYFLGASSLTTGSGVTAFNVSFPDVSFAGTIVTATATNAANQTSEFSQCVRVDGADLDLAMSVNEDTSRNAGENIIYTLTTTNDGPANATGVVVSDVLPVDLTYVSDTCGGAYNAGNGNWTIGSLASGSSVSCDITAEIGVTDAAMTNTMSVTAANEADANSLNNTASITVEIGRADLALESSLNAAALDSGQTLYYTLTVTNQGPNEAAAIIVESVIPDGLTFVNEATTQGTYDELTGEWSVGTLASETEAVLNLTMTVDAGTGGTTLTQEGSVTSASTADSNSANNTTSVSIDINPETNLALTQSANSTVVNSVQQVTYTLTLSNPSTVDASAIFVRDLLPSQMSFTSASLSHGVYDRYLGMWRVDNLAAGASATLTIQTVVNVGVPSGEVITNTPSLYSAQPVDGQSSDNTAESSIVVQNLDLAVTQLADNNAPHPNDSIRYTVNVVNNGPLNATGVVLTDTLPTGVTFSAVSPADVCSAASGIVTCNLGSLTSGSNTSVTIDVLVNAGTLGSIANQVSVHSAEVESTSANNSSSLSLNVTTPATPVPTVPPNIQISEQEFFATMEQVIATNADITEINFALADFVPAAVNLTLRLTNGTVVNVVVNVSSADGFVVLNIASITSPSETVSSQTLATINRELPILLVATFDDLFIAKAGEGNNPNTITVSDNAIDVTFTP
jgi:uncharacterized repeat protein (TIGR01451 family)